MEPWAIALLPLVGVVVGATLQFWLSRAAAREQRAEALRSQVYADYLRAVAAAGHYRTNEDRDAAEAKARIAVYGTAEVIRALSRFEAGGAVISDGPGARAFVALVTAMRPAGGAVPNDALELLLMGTAKQGDAPVGASRGR